MSRDQQRYRKNYSYYRPLPREGTITFAADESLDWKNSVRVASTGNHALSGVGTSLSIGGVTVVDEDRVLLKDQLTLSQNGIYYFEVSGGNYTLTRASDARQGTLSTGAATYVEEGTNGGKIYILSTTGTITVDSTSLTWTEFSSGGGGGGGNDYWVSTTANAIYSTGSVAIRGGLGSVDSAADIGSDVFFFVSGSITGSGVNDKKAVFGGDVRMSGSLEVSGDQVEITGSLSVTNGITGSLTRLTDGTAYILAGPNITINTGSNGAVQISGSSGGGVTGTGTTDYLPIWTSSTSLGNSPIRLWSSDIVAYDKKYHWFRESGPGTNYVYINSNSATGGRVGVNIDPDYPLHVTLSTSATTLEFARFRNTNSGEGSGVQQTYVAGNFFNPTFRITHAWPANVQGHYTYFGIAKPTPSGTTTPEIVERVRLFSSGAIELSGSVTVRQDSEIASNKTVFEVQKSNGNQILWISSSSGTNPVGSDVFVWVSGSRTDNNTGADKVVFGGDVRVSGSLAVGTGSVFITSNDIQFGSSAMRIQRSSSDMTFFANSAESFRIKSGGNIGINTNNPSEKLHVNSGNVKVDTTGYGIILPSSPTNVGAQTLDCYLETEMEVSLVCLSEGTITLDPAYDMLRMTRTGRSVHLQGKLKVDATNTTAGGDLWIDLSGTGIPDNGAFDSAGAVYLTGFSASLVEPVYAIIDAGGNKIYLRRFYQGSLVSDLANYIAKGSGTAEITVSITYSI